MTERERLIELYLTYGSLLTNNERSYFEYYYYEDYSLTEIAINHKVSKSNVSKVLNTTIDKLNEYENKLKINERHNKIKTLLVDVKDNYIIEKIEELL